MGYISMHGLKGWSFWSVLVWNRSVFHPWRESTMGIYYILTGSEIYHGNFNLNHEDRRWIARLKRVENLERQERYPETLQTTVTTAILNIHSARAIKSHNGGPHITGAGAGATQRFSANHKTSSEQKNRSSFISNQMQMRSNLTAGNIDAKGNVKVDCGASI